MKRIIKLNRKFISLFLAVMMIYSMSFSGLTTSAAVTDPNGDWTAKTASAINTSEAQLMVRVGDIDNFGYGWGNINPFSGNETSTHGFPFYPNNDSDGTDRIMVVSGYSYSSNYKTTGTTRDGYTEKTSRSDTNGKDNDNNVRSIDINYDLNSISVNNATIQMFLDDFQPGNAKGVTQGNVAYTATINGQEVPELSNVINNLDESGPIGKLITFQIPQRYLDLVRTGKISIKIDDSRADRKGDGYAIDFVKLLINRTGFTSTATISGNVKDTNNRNIGVAKVSAGGVAETLTDANGNYVLNNVPAGQAIVTASKTGYNSQTYTEKTVIAGYGYTHNFTLTTNTPPMTPTITATPTSSTNSKVTATIGYSSDSTIQQYRINIGGTTGEWKVYAGYFDVTQNCIIEAQGINQYGNESQIASYTVGNIDTTPPILTLTPSTINAANGTVTITATASDSGSGVASITKPDNTVVIGSSATYTVSANGDCSFKATDNAGNVTTQSLNVSNISNMPEVKITVTDATGTLDEYSVSSDNALKRVDKDVIDKNYVLKGDSYANFSLNSTNANAFQYSILSGNKPVNMPINGWNTIDLQSQVVNQDVVLDKQGYLTQRAYDVNHMLTLTDTTNWSNPEQVFKYPYPEIGYKSANTSTTKDAYGVMEKVVPYTITDVTGAKTTVDTRWASNTAFMSNMDIFGAYKEASKFWGYIRVPEDGNYILGAASDDGCRGWITVNGETKQFVDMFKPQGVTFGTKNVTLNLKKGKYYPLYLEYFNWGGSAAFQLNYVKEQSTLTNSNKTTIPNTWFYPSTSTSPGEYAQTLFTGSQGVKLPDSPGQYYIAYRTGTKNSDGSISSNTNSYRDGIYGPFTVKPTAPLELTKKLNSDVILNGQSFEINYTITPKPIPIADFNNTNTQNFEVSNIKFSESLPVGLKIDTLKLDPNKLEIALNGNDRDISGVLKQTIKYQLDTTGNQYIAQPINFSIWVSSVTPNNYSMLGKDSYITYLDIDGGSRSKNFNDLNIVVNSDNIAPILTLTANPTTPTNRNVTITATASDSQSGVASITKPDTTGVTDSTTTYIVSTNGTYTFKATDNAGNVTTQSITVSNIDTTGPNLTLTPNIIAITNGSVIITANASDNVAVASITKPDKTTVTGSSTTYTVTANGTYTFTATDTAGNVTTQTITVSNIDTTAPILTLTPSTTAATNGSVIITASASDNVAVASITKPDKTIVTDSSTTYTVSVNGTYTFTAIDTVGNVTTQTIIIDNIDKIAPTLTLTPSTTAVTNESVIITANASDNVAVASITKPDNTIVTDSSTTYTVSDNGTYTFTAIDTAGNVTTENIIISNIYGQSIILNHALYNGNGTELINKNNVTATIPVTLAMIVDVESSNPVINWSADKTKITTDNIVFKKYEISDGGTIGNSETVTLSNSGDINITGLTMKKGKKYIIIYTITPIGSGQVTITAIADGTSSKSVILNIGDKPDLF